MRMFNSKKGIALFLAGAVLFTACGGRTRNMETDTPKETAEQVMNAIKELDLKTFNAYTDNYEGVCWSFFGFPVEKEYKVFQELLKPHIYENKWYKEKHRFAEKVVENLTWEIGEVQEEKGGKKASIELTLTNKDMAEAMENYTMWVVEDAVRDAGIGAVSIVKNISLTVNECDDDLIRFIDETEHTWTEEVTVTAVKEEGVWKLKLTEEFINAFMGNIDSQEYEGSLDQHIDEYIDMLMEEIVE